MRERFKSTVRKISSNQLARDTATLSAGNVVRLVLQAGYFIAIARSLGPHQYGAFVAMAAIVGMAVPFAGLGSPNILLKNVSRDRSLLAGYWGNGLVLIFISGSILSGIILVVGPFFVGRQLSVALLLVCVSDLMLARVADLAGFAFAGLGRMGETARLNIYVSLSRLIGILLLSATVAKPSVQQWTAVYLLSSTLCFLYAFVRITLIAGRISVNLRRIRRELAESGFFAVSQSATTIYNDIDKTMLARLADFSATGIYGAAYRIIDVSMAPVSAMTAAAYPEFFRRGVGGPVATQEYAWKLIKRARIFGFVILVGLLAGAPIIPHVLGNNYRASVEAIRWLAPIPLLRCMHLFLADALSGAGFQGLRTAVQVGIGLLNIWLNLFFITRWSWRGAAWTSVMCDAALVVTLWAALKWARQRESRVALVGVQASAD